MSIIPNTEIPQDVWQYIGSFLPLHDLSPFLRTCRTLNTMRGAILEILARVEKDRLRIPIFQGFDLRSKVDLRSKSVAKHLRELDLRTSKDLAISLGEKPLVLYSDRFDSAMVLLRPDVLAARRKQELKIERSSLCEYFRSLKTNDPEKHLSSMLKLVALLDDLVEEIPHVYVEDLHHPEELHGSLVEDLASLGADPEKIAILKANFEEVYASLLGKEDLAELSAEESDLEKACIIAQTIADENLQREAFQKILSREEVSLNKALEIAQDLPEEARSEALRYIVVSEAHLGSARIIEKALERTGIPLEEITAIYEVNLEPACTIAKTIPNKKIRTDVFQAIFSSIPLKPGLKMVRTLPEEISGEVLERNYPWHSYSRLEEQIQIIVSIPDKKVKDDLLHHVLTWSQDSHPEVPLKNILSFVEQIEDPVTRDKALSNIAFFRKTSLSTEEVLHIADKIKNQETKFEMLRVFPSVYRQVRIRNTALTVIRSLAVILLAYAIYNRITDRD